MLRGLLAAISVVILTACATPATHEGMTVAQSDLPAQLNEALNGAIYVGSVSGGEETNPLWTSEVDAPSFRQALDGSLQVAGYKGAEADGNYRLDAKLLELHQPHFGMTFDVVSNVEYKLTRNGQVRVFPVTATGTATVSDAFVAIERLRLANEKSMKENIRIFVEQVSSKLR